VGPIEFKIEAGRDGNWNALYREQNCRFCVDCLASTIRRPVAEDRKKSRCDEIDNVDSQVTMIYTHVNVMIVKFFISTFANGLFPRLINQLVNFKI
jgi:hypothetical protein